MATLEHIYATPTRDKQAVVVKSNTFPNKSLLFGSNTRIGCEIAYDALATKTGGGQGDVIVDEYGVPSIKGAPGEYTFSWHVIDKDDLSSSSVYTCTMTTTAFGDITAPTVTLTTSLVSVVKPEIIGTVDDTTARVVVTINSIDYPAVNDGAGGWSIAAGIIDGLSAGANAVTVRAIDEFDNVGSDSGDITYEGSEYTMVSDFDVAASAIDNGWTDEQSVASISSQIGSATLTGGTGVNPTYSAADDSLVFTLSPATKLSNTSVPAFREIFVVLTDTNSTNFLSYFEVGTSAANMYALNAGGATNKWRVNTTEFFGRVNGDKNVVHIRYETDSTIVSTNGGTETTITSTGLVPADLIKIYVHNHNFNGTSMKLHEIATTATLNSTQRAAVIDDLKTKWGIA